MMILKTTHKEQGFTLVEMMIVIIIVGLLAASGLDLGAGRYQRARAEATNNTLEAVKEALESYVAQAGVLPCPAAWDAAPGTAAFGTPGDCADTATNPGDCESGYCIQGGRPVDHDGDPDTAEEPLRVRIGAVPARALNIPFDAMTDGWDNMITYAVTEALARTPAEYEKWGGGIAVVDEGGYSVLTPPQTARFMLISHGSDGAGARVFGDGSVGQPCPAGGGNAPLDRDNCTFNDDEAVFRTAAFSQSNSSAHYDDMVRYLTGIAPASGSTEVNVTVAGDAFGTREIVGTTSLQKSFVALGAFDQNCADLYGEGAHMMRSSEIKRTLTSNSASGWIYCDDVSINDGSTVASCSTIGNIASSGGGIRLNCTYSGYSYWGAVLLNGFFSLENCNSFRPAVCVK